MKNADELADRIETLATDEPTGPVLSDLWRKLQEHRDKLQDALTRASSTPADSDSWATRWQREYLREPDVRKKIEVAIRRIQGISERLPIPTPDPSGVDQEVGAARVKVGRRARSTALTATLKGTPITPAQAVATQVVAGASTGLSAPAGQDSHEVQLVDLNLAIEAFLAAVASVVGEASDVYQDISSRLPDELRRRGIDA